MLSRTIIRVARFEEQPVPAPPTAELATMRLALGLAIIDRQSPEEPEIFPAFDHGRPATEEHFAPTERFPRAAGDLPRSATLVDAL